MADLKFTTDLKFTEDHVCNTIPEGWRIKLTIGRDTGCLQLIDPSNELVAFDDEYNQDGDIRRLILGALEHAKRAHNQENDKRIDKLKEIK